MGFLKDSRHRLGFHTGDWVYDTAGSCEQTRRCTGCSDVSVRERHTLSDWAYQEPRYANACAKNRSCQRCPLTETKADHAFATFYIEDLEGRPDLAAAMGDGYRLMAQPCAAVAGCKFCNATGNQVTIIHRWAYPKHNDDDGKLYTTCRGCGKVKVS